ncbi:FG-GAP-like repeat-containing protein [Kitasatospora purpeofusca]|uniref:FG-GAP-like repeat-containing protein n=1 Tax=Kitasatospora purpeofusca TaxID=67352 RepID=UPI0036D3D074
MSRPKSAAPPRRLLAGAVAVALTAATLTALTATAQAEPAKPDRAADAQADPARPAPATAGKAEPLTADQASASARKTGKAVKADAATTATDELVANADGSFTLTQNVAPVRRYREGAWRSLDATLVRHEDGTVGPALAATDLSLSGGGPGPLATMRSGPASMSLELPGDLAAKLPAPTLDGATATYAIQPGIDLKVTVDTLGGFSEVFVVKDAKAAANPALRKLAFKTRTKGVDLATDQAGNITAKDGSGRTLFSAPAPAQGIWDSAADPNAATVPDARTGIALDAKSGSPAESSHTDPGAHAHTARLASEYHDGAIVLTPDQSILNGRDTVWPLYIDPSYSAGGTIQNWTYVSSAFPNQSYWRTSDANGLRVGYNGWESPNYVGRAFAQLSVPPQLSGAQITGSVFTLVETYAPSCDSRDVELWWTGGIGSGTTWNNQPGWLGKLDTKNEAHGYSSSCPAAGVGFNALGAVQSAVANGASDVTLGLRASNESDMKGWKKFQPSSMGMTTTYNHAPSTPDGLSTSPATSCTANPPSVVGNGDVTLYANVNDADGGGLNANFTVVKEGTGTVVASGNPGATAGTTSGFLVPRSTLVNAAGGAATTFAWNVQATDGSATSPTSTTCRFAFDPTVPGAPVITPPANPAYQVGTAAAFTFSPNGTGAAPSGFLYQLNGASPVSVKVTGAATATAAIKPTRAVNTLTVTSVSPGGNIGDTAILIFNAAAPATAAENDLTGNGRADLAVVGGQAGLPAGYWLASGASDKSINTAADNIGARGTGANAPGSAADWTGTQAVTGRYATGGGFNDVLSYNPSTGAGSILFGSGDGSALSPNSGSQVNVSTRIFTDSTTGAKAAQVANAGALYQAANQLPGVRPGLLLLLDNRLTLSGPAGIPGAFEPANSSVPLSATNPTGTGNWAGWTIHSALVGNLPALYARDTVTGQLWYYSPTALTNLAVAALLGIDKGPTAPVKVAGSGWSGSALPALQAADINRDGTADLWSVDTNGAVTAHLFNGTALSSQGAQLLVTSTHTWPLDDNATEGAVVATAADRVGGLNLTGSGPGATWSNKDLFKPDVHLGGSSKGGVLSSAGPAVDVANSFTVSVWTKPDKLGGVVLSQDGTVSSGFKLFPDATTGQWSFCLATADNATPGWDCATAGGAVQLGVWTHLTATYNQGTKTLALYVNGIVANANSHTAVTGFTKSLRIGDYLANGISQSFFNPYKGAVSNVQAWAGTALNPTQVALLSGTPGYVLFPSDGTDHPSGSTWAAGNARMRFDAGQLAITNPGYGTWSMGSADQPNAVLTLQSDGNLVAYPQPAHSAGTALWSSGTYSQPGDVMFFQPDGNLVIYRADGLAIWESGSWSRGLHNNAADESGGTGKLRYADFDGDHRADAITIADNGAISVKLNNGGDGHGGWISLGQVTGGVTTDRTKVRFADFDGDGRADYIVFNGGAVNVWLNNGGDGHGGWIHYGQVTTGATSDPDQVRFADFTGDGKADYIITQAGGNVGVFQNNGGDGHGGWSDLGQVAGGVTDDRSRIRWADVDGDGKADYNIINLDGAVTTYINKGGDGHGGWYLRPRIITGTTTDQNLVNFADVNGDNRVDYLVTNGPTTARLSNGGDDFATPGWIDWGQILPAV